MASQMVAIPAPEGYIVNFDDPVRMGDTAGYWVFGVGIMLSFSFLCMRTYTKVLFAKNFAVEDSELCCVCCGTSVDVANLCSPDGSLGE